jgi:hypothetical protein
MKILSLNINEVLKETKKYIDKKTENKPLLNKLLTDMLRKDIFNYKLIKIGIAELEQFEREFQRRYKNESRLITPYLTASDARTGENLFNCSFSTKDEGDETFLCLKYTIKKIDEKDPFEIFVKNLIDKYIFPFYAQEDVKREFKNSFIEIIKQQIDDVLLQSTAMIEELEKEELTEEDFEKYIFLRFVGTISFEMWGKNYDNN